MSERLAVPNTQKNAGVLYPAALRERALANATRFPWAAEQVRQFLDAAAPWLAMTDDELWNLMFGNTISRSWHVWSNGFCPACRRDVTMYEWKMDALRRPWKTECPHCGEFFPKNDFAAFYRSGLDATGIFQPTLANRSLLVNAEHPDPADPLHDFGVDDGEGYVDGDHRWRFIGAYLIYGQWKQAIVGGIRSLAAAYFVSGESVYAHKAAILLDRVADLYPSFDFHLQGLVYERQGDHGYVSTWHDACEETRILAQAYDQIFDGIEEDAALVAFLSCKTSMRSKATTSDIRRNIEAGILLDALQNQEKIYNNYPRREVANLTILTVLGWPENRQHVMALLDEIVAEGTAVDGVSGEKGLTGYSRILPMGLAELLQRFSSLEQGFLADVVARHPRLRKTWHFHLDTWVNGQYYPHVGDCGSFAARDTTYQGVELKPTGWGIDTLPTISMYSFLFNLYQATGDPAYLQVLYQANGNTVDGLPHDLLAEDPAALQREVAAVIDRDGTTPRAGSIDLREWHLLMLRSGEGDDSRALWLDYDNGGKHPHADAMNLGLFAKGLDLLPDFGYPQVQFGGWESPEALWYTASSAHNTVVVDRQVFRQQWLQIVAGRTTLWANGACFHAARLSGPELIDGQQYERTAALIDISARDSYVIDIFRVVGGTDHAKFQYAHFGKLTTTGLQLAPGEDFGPETLIRHVRTDAAAQPGWTAEWAIEDRRGYLPAGADIHLRYTDLTTGAAASTAEAWVVPDSFSSTAVEWIPSLILRRQSDIAPLASTFVAVLEPFDGQSNISAIRRLPLQNGAGEELPENHVAIEVTLADGAVDLFLAADVEDPLKRQPAWDGILYQPEWNVRLTGECCWIRRTADKSETRLAVYQARALIIGELRLKFPDNIPFREMVVSGK